MLGNIIFYTLATIGGLMVGLLILFYLLAAFLSIDVEQFDDKD